MQRRAVYEAPLTHFVHDDLRFDVTDTGPPDGEPVVLLHGFPQTRHCWTRVIPLLTAEGYRVVAPDQRGYSPSARPHGRRAYRLVSLPAPSRGARGISRGAALPDRPDRGGGGTGAGRAARGAPPPA